MFLQLVIKQIKEEFKSLTFYLFILILILFYVTNFVSDGNLNSKANLAPLTSEEYVSMNMQPYWGSAPITDLSEQMERIIVLLQRDVSRKMIDRYKAGIYRGKNLSDIDIDFLTDSIERLKVLGGVPVEAETEERFFDLLDSIDAHFNGGTSYSEQVRESVLIQPRTYEEALAEFTGFLDPSDKLTGVYARLFSDYMGICAGFFPVFLIAFLLLKDERSRMAEIIYSRRFSSSIYVLSKFTGVFLSICFIFLAIATHATIVFSAIAWKHNYVIDYFAFYRYTLYWVIPTALFSSTLSFLIATLTGSGILAILVQFGLWISSIMPLKGDYRITKYIIRFNALESYANFKQFTTAIAVNRIFYTILSLIFLILTICIWSAKRGRVNDVFSASSLLNRLQHKITGK
jgi:hypothetical protein